MIELMIVLALPFLLWLPIIIPIFALPFLIGLLIESWREVRKGYKDDIPPPKYYTYAEKPPANPVRLHEVIGGLLLWIIMLFLLIVLILFV